MSEFKREDRYIVIKRSDLAKVPVAYRKYLVDPLFHLLPHLPQREFVVVEGDWPEFEPTWAAIEARVTGVPVLCDHEWNDDGEFMLICTNCGAQEDHSPNWRDVDTAPRDGTMLRLLVRFEEHSTEDAEEAATIGANNYDNDGEDRWQFAGWCWDHDHFTEGKGEVVGWLPMMDEPKTSNPAEQGYHPDVVAGAIQGEDKYREEIARLNALLEQAYQDGWNDGQEAIERRYQNTPRTCNEGWKLFQADNNLPAGAGQATDQPKEGWPEYHKRKMETLRELVAGYHERKQAQRDEQLRKIANACACPATQAAIDVLLTSAAPGEPPLCQDEGCPHHGVPHVCVTPKPRGGAV